MLAANALLHSGDDAAKKEHLPGIASGETIATLAFTEANGKWDESGIEATATKDGDGYKLNGTKMFVLDGHTADLILVAAKYRRRRLAVRRRSATPPASPARRWPPWTRPASRPSSSSPTRRPS